MKITVNKEIGKERLAIVLADILRVAQEKASQGYSRFEYHFEEGDRDRFPKDINILVNQESEGTVTCGYGCDYGSYVIYFIKMY